MYTDPLESMQLCFEQQALPLVYCSLTRFSSFFGCRIHHFLSPLTTQVSDKIQCSDDENRAELWPVGKEDEHGRTAPGDAPRHGTVWVWGLPGPARVGSVDLGGKAEGPAAADPSPGDMLVSPRGPELPVGWEESERTGLPTGMTAAAAGFLWTFCITHSKYWFNLQTASNSYFSQCNAAKPWKNSINTLLWPHFRMMQLLMEANK